LYRCAHNRYLLRTLQGLHDALALLGESTLHDKARAESTQAEHEAIIRAIKERNPEAAEQATRAHIRNAQFERVKREFNRVR
jgi:DNA-binding FadR family transcriptional regulator